MAGLLEGVLPAIFSGADEVKRRVKGLLTEPRATMGLLNEDAASRMDQMRAMAYQNDPNKARAGGLFPAQAAATPEFNAQQAEAAQQRLADIAMQGLTVWHGSPHKFDKFDSSKIGTGEGAQAYGHGLYLAESPDVAKYYQQTGINATPSIRKNGVRVEDELLSSTRPGDNVFMAQINADTPRGRDLTEKDLEKVKESLRHHADLYAGSPREAYYQDALNRFDELKAKVLGGRFGYEEGNLYKVDLPDSAIEKMLDWDKPLSQQPEAVRKAYEALSDAERAALNKQVSKLLARDGGDGATVYKAFGGYDNPAAASERLKAAGIPGIRYLDGGSRGTGQGTRNFVVFDDQLPKILEVNGQGLLGR